MTGFDLDLVVNNSVFRNSEAIQTEGSPSESSNEYFQAEQTSLEL